MCAAAPTRKAKPLALASQLQSRAKIATALFGEAPRFLSIQAVFFSYVFLYFFNYCCTAVNFHLWISTLDRSGRKTSNTEGGGRFCP